MILVKKSKDLKFGFSQEILVLEKLKKTWPNLEKTKNRYCIYDFEDEENIFELKSRKCNHNSFYDIMVSINKVNCLLNSDKRGYLVYNFKDGIYYTEITEEIIRLSRIEKFRRKNRGSGVDFETECLYIPNYLLTKLNDE